MQNFGYETNNFTYLEPFDNLVCAKIEIYESEGTVSNPKLLADRPSKPKLGFNLNDFLPKLKIECDKNGSLSPNQVDELKQKALRLQIELESIANGESKRPNLNG